MYRVVTVVNNNTVLNTRNLLRVDLRRSSHTKSGK